jgi:hypothetical protein
MFKKNLKLIATAIGLVTVLVMGLAMPGVTQQPPSPWTPPFRPKIPEALNQVISGTLTASEGDILDTEAAMLASTGPVTFAYIPLHPSSRSAQRLKDWLEKGEPFGEFLYLGALYLENDLRGSFGFDSLKAGTYYLKVLKNLRLIAVDPTTGEESTIGIVSLGLLPQGSAKYSVVKEEGPLPALLVAIILICAADPHFEIKVGEVQVKIGC